MNHCPTDGTPWHTTGGIIAVPPGSVAIAIPQAGCGCPEEDAGGTIPDAEQVPIVAPFGYPKVASAFAVPAINSIGQLYSKGASVWAFPNLLIWLSAHNGYLLVNGVSGDLVTFKNLTIPAGTNIAADTPLVPYAPVYAVAGGGEGGEPDPSTQADSILGLEEGVSVLFEGETGDLLQNLGGKWKKVNTPLFHFLSAQPSLLDVKRDVVSSTHATDKWANPVLSAITGTVPTGTVTFPQFPELVSGQSIKALVRVKWKFASKVLDSVRLKVTINGYEWQAVSYCQAVSAPATAAGAAAFTAELNNKGAENTALLVIPVTSDNAPMTVAVDARKALNTTAPLDANCHYFAAFTVIGYWY